MSRRNTDPNPVSTFQANDTCFASSAVRPIISTFTFRVAFTTTTCRGIGFMLHLASATTK